MRTAPKSVPPRAIERLACAAILFALAAASACANPVVRPVVSIHVPVAVLVAWIAMKWILFLTRRKVSLFSLYPFLFACALSLMFFFAFVLSQDFIFWREYEFVFVFLSIYLVSLVARLAFQLPDEHDSAWKTNLIFHGFFLAVMMALGASRIVMYHVSGWRLEYRTNWFGVIMLAILPFSAIALIPIVMAPRRNKTVGREDAKT